MNTIIESIGTSTLCILINEPNLVKFLKPFKLRQELNVDEILNSST